MRCLPAFRFNAGFFVLKVDVLGQPDFPQKYVKTCGQKMMSYDAGSYVLGEVLNLVPISWLWGSDKFQGDT